LLKTLTIITFLSVIDILYRYHSIIIIIILLTKNCNGNRKRHLFILFVVIDNMLCKPLCVGILQSNLYIWISWLNLYSLSIVGCISTNKYRTSFSFQQSNETNTSPQLTNNLRVCQTRVDNSRITHSKLICTYFLNMI
jgi:hypothetical protein